MALVYLSPVGGAAAQFFDNNGVPLVAGQIYTYAAGSSTPQVTYTSSSGSIAQANPIILDSTGRIPSGELWLSAGLSYKFVIEDFNNNVIGTYDNIKGINDFYVPFTNIVDFTGDGTTTLFTLPVSISSSNNVNIFINGVYQMKSSYSITGLSLSFTQAPPITSKIELEY